MSKKQEEIYLEKEGDRWYTRGEHLLNSEDLSEHHKHEIEAHFRYFDKNKMAPKRILEVGCSNGYALKIYKDRYKDSECFGVEPSSKAVKEGNEKFEGIKLFVGTGSDLSRFTDGYFDIVLVKGVFCWIGRDTLFKSLSEIDRVLCKDGHLIIGDYLPEYQIKNRNHHLKEEEIYCFKTDHSKIFLSSHIYTLMYREVEFWEDGYKGKFGDNRYEITIMKKSYKDYYY
ncbi:MAG: class I SAM-dependent methyltransferase [Candidatus Micrarchaeota archaeon]|nr:class I SAM-dependent methyltransferase [Candidatus Micrarchaeota archaeon]